MLSFFKQHWLAYLIAAAVAIVIGLGGAYVVGVWGSTPEDTAEEQASEEAATGDETAAGEGAAEGTAEGEDAAAAQ